MRLCTPFFIFKYMIFRNFKKDTNLFYFLSENYNTYSSQLSKLIRKYINCLIFFFPYFDLKFC